MHLYFSDNNIRVNEGAYKGCTSPMKKTSEINYNFSSEWLKDETFWNKEVWGGKYLMDAT